MKLPTVFMYSGQGSQYYKMGLSLYASNSQFKTHVDCLNQIATDVLGRSLLDELFQQDRKASDSFEHQLLSSMALYLIECALTLTLRDSGIEPDKVMGSSLGLLAALTAAGCISEEEGFHFIDKMMTCFMNEATPGRMIAVHEDIDIYESSFLLNSNCELAGVNFQSSFVLSMLEENFELAEGFLKERNCVYLSMPVPFAYHSVWMNHLEAKIVNYFSSIEHKPARLPIYCCAHKGELDSIDNDTFWTAIRQPLLLPETLNSIEKQGSHHYIDLGPSGGLATAVRYCFGDSQNSPTTILMSPFKKGNVNLVELINRP